MTNDTSLEGMIDAEPRTRLLVDIGDTIFISGEKHRVKSNRWMGNHKWILPKRGCDGFIRKDLAQNFMNEGKARFYA